MCFSVLENGRASTLSKKLKRMLNQLCIHPKELVLLQKESWSKNCEGFAASHWNYQKGHSWAYFGSTNEAASHKCPCAKVLWSEKEPHLAASCSMTNQILICLDWGQFFFREVKANCLGKPSSNRCRAALCTDWKGTSGCCKWPREISH